MTEHPRHIKKGKRKEEKEEISLARLHVEEFFGPWGPIVACTIIGNLDEVLLKYLLIVPSSFSTWEHSASQR